jgi:hypothetical protein
MFLECDASFFLMLVRTLFQISGRDASVMNFCKAGTSNVTCTLNKNELFTVRCTSTRCHGQGNEISTKTCCLLGEPFFNFFLHFGDDVPTSELTFGGYDSSKDFEDDITFLVKLSAETYWQIEMDKVTPSNLCSMSGPACAMVDSGISHMTGLEKETMQFAMVVDAK